MPFIREQATALGGNWSSRVKTIHFHIQIPLDDRTYTSHWGREGLESRLGERKIEAVVERGQGSGGQSAEGFFGWGS